MSAENTDQDCKLVMQPILNAFGTLSRTVQAQDASVYATSTLIVYRSDDFARAALARWHDDATRCKTERDSANRVAWDRIHPIEVPKPKGLDDVVAEEGHSPIDEKGGPADTYYTYITGRKGPFLVQSYMARSGTQVQNREQALNALSLMASRLH
ncbi:hypothetical protein JK359_32310 [Streptomyces actinomycinicus]|uniref:PknH-like extracellular domain-containing protein n=1 Tax=Streptomyces actinomycinicus TaxID=1695166 RepID=A0A937JP96_9ACTN|nr:hypothetical protein [Streptomyces actinomycinicus]MBL1086589.1 hypothetical protein [Streptomyces actinomycinicus]